MTQPPAQPYVLDPLALTGPQLLSEVRADLKELQKGFTAFAAKLDDTPSKVADHEARLRVLEAARWKLIGASAVLGVLGGVLGNLIPLVAR